MKVLITLGAVFILSATAFAQRPNPSTYQKEPPLKFQVNINGKQYNMTEGEDLQLESTLSNPKLSIKVFDNRTLDNGLLSFDYPRYFAYEYESDKEYKIWTLSGNDLTIMIFNFTEATSLDAYVDGLVSNFGKENCKVEKTKKRLGNKTLTGKRINVSMASSRLSLDVLEFQPGTGFITFQDSKTEDGKSSEESSKVAKLVDASIKYK